MDRLRFDPIKTLFYHILMIKHLVYGISHRRNIKTLKNLLIESFCFKMVQQIKLSIIVTNTMEIY
jgi:hypothetical protein